MGVQFMAGAGTLSSLLRPDWRQEASFLQTMGSVYSGIKCLKHEDDHFLLIVSVWCSAYTLW